MFSGVINKNSPQIDVLESLSGVWNQYKVGDWQIVKTPMFCVMTATIDKGSHVLPFKFSVPVPGLVYGAGGSVKCVVIRPGDTAVDMPESGLMQIQVFGDMAKLEAIR